MKIPDPKGTEEAFDQKVADWVSRMCKHTDSGTIVCKKCGSRILTVYVYPSVHYFGFSGCAGGGEVRTKALPYCLSCEGKPALDDLKTCIHE